VELMARIIDSGVPTHSSTESAPTLIAMIQPSPPSMVVDAILRIGVTNILKLLHRGGAVSGDSPSSFQFAPSTPQAIDPPETLDPLQRSDQSGFIQAAEAAHVEQHGAIAPVCAVN
jgi:hypothetical protein